MICGLRPRELTVKKTTKSDAAERQSIKIKFLKIYVGRFYHPLGDKTAGHCLIFRAQHTPASAEKSHPGRPPKQPERGAGIGHRQAIRPCTPKCVEPDHTGIGWWRQSKAGTAENATGNRATVQTPPPQSDRRPTFPASSISRRSSIGPRSPACRETYRNSSSSIA